MRSSMLFLSLALLPSLLAAEPFRIEFKPTEPKSTAYAPVEPLDDFTATVGDGVLLRDGKPYFWVGNGVDLGSGHATPAGLWLARLQGQTFVAIPNGVENFSAKLKDGTLTVGARYSASCRSWLREAERLGFAVQTTVTSGEFKWSPLKKYTADSPELAEAHYQCGHFLSLDTVHPLGRRLMALKREAAFRELEDDPRYFAELAREPGPEPCNRRVQDAFREWAKAKYGTLAEANAAWRTDYADWAAVRPPHLPEKIIYSGGYLEKSRLRKLALANRTEMYYDWLIFATEDSMRGTAGEIADVRRMAPGIRLGQDLRGHMNSDDKYMLYDVNALDALVDVFGIHSGFSTTYYSGGAYDERTLRGTMAFPVFSHNFFRTNTAHPIWNSEDIVSGVGCASSNPDAMRRNDLAQLMEGDWDFAEDREEKGVAEKWYERPAAVAWQKIAVPAAWDELPAHRGYSGTAWYRRAFRLPAVYRNDFEDGSRKFYFAGAGMSQFGEVWLNGHRVGEVKGWNTAFALDVGKWLSYGGTNELVIRVCGNGGFMNGLRGHYHILPGDLMGERRPFGEGDYKAMLWGYLMRGVSAVSVWNWSPDPFRPYFPELTAKLNEVAAFALPALRRQQRSRVAFLYPYLYARGLPHGSQLDDAKVWQTWFNAAFFDGTEPDVMSEETLARRLTPERYPLLIAPAAALVHEKTYEAFKAYLAAGGTAIVTEDSFGRTFSRYRRTDVASLGGKRIVMPADMTMEAAQKAFAPYLPKRAFDYAVEPNGENPLVECAFEGTDAKKVLYFKNWGAKDAKVKFGLPAALKGWKLTALEGDFARTPLGFGDTYSAEVPSQRPIVAVLSRDGNYEWKMPASVASRTAELRRLAATVPSPASPSDPAKGPGVSGKRALFLTPSSRRTGFSGPEIHPNLVWGLQARGYAVDALPAKAWTAETLAKYDLVVLAETQTYAAKELAGQKNLHLVVERVKAGGKLLFMSYTAGTVNAEAMLLKQGDWKELGIAGMGAGASSRKHATYGDPNQLTTPAVAGPLAEGVGSVSLYCSSALKLTKNSPLKPVVSFPKDAEGKGAGKPVVAAGEVGAGKVVVLTDAMLFLPTRIEKADNARLLENVLDYLK